MTGVERALQLRANGKTLPQAVSVLQAEGFEPQINGTKLTVLTEPVMAMSQILAELRSGNRKALAGKVEAKAKSIGSTNPARMLDWQSGQVIK